MGDKNDDEIRKLYNDPITGLKDIALFARENKIPLSRVRQVLSGNDPYTQNVPNPPKSYPMRRIIVSEIDEQWEIDLQDFPLYVDSNKGYRYILCVIDDFSKFGWARGLKTKTARETKEAFEDILNSTERRPQKILSDLGTEFEGDFRRYLEQKGIEVFHINSDLGAPIVERWNRTLKMRFSRLFDVQFSYNWIDSLQKVVQGYNNTYHSSIKMTPSQASLKVNEPTVYENLYSDEYKPVNDKIDLKEGDYVRIFNKGDRFTKEHHTRWSIAHYKIKRIVYTNPITYELIDLGNPPMIIGKKYYREELFKTNKPEKFNVGRILSSRTRRGKKESLVQWLGYPDDPRFNTWEPTEEVKKV